MDHTFSSQTAVSDTNSLVIINRCLNGEEAAYVVLYNMYASMIYRLSMGLLQNREDAEEVMQDSFEYAFRTLAKYDPNKAGFKTWLFQIAISRCRNKRRRKWLPTFSINQLESDTLPDQSTQSLEEQLHLTQEQQRVWQAIQNLTPKLRETAVLRTYAGLSYAEIGSVLKIPAKTAESRMRLAHKSLKNLLQEKVDD